VAITAGVHSHRPLHGKGFQVEPPAVYAALAVEEFASALKLISRQKTHRLLIVKDHPKRTLSGTEPVFQFNARRPVPPVAGQQESVK